MSFTTEASSRARHLALRGGNGDTFPAALLAVLVAENVKRGWLRATGILEDVELRPVVESGGASGQTVAGPVYLLGLECAIGAEAAGGSDLVFRGVVAFEADAGYQTMAVQIVRARVRTMDVLVTVLDDIVLPRTWKAAIAATAPAQDFGTRPAAMPPRAPNSLAAVAPSAMPQRRPPPPTLDPDGLVPEPGDSVEHFAFGHGDVVKSDGYRLHIRAQKDGRVREIALEMLRVVLLGDSAESAGARHFKLERRL